MQSRKLVFQTYMEKTPIIISQRKTPLRRKAKNHTPNVGQETSKEVTLESAISASNNNLIEAQKPMLAKAEDAQLLKDPGLYLIGQCANSTCKMNQLFCDLDIAISLGIGEFTICSDEQFGCPTCSTALETNFNVLKFYDCKYEVVAESTAGDKCTLSGTLKQNKDITVMLPSSALWNKIHIITKSVSISNNPLVMESDERASIASGILSGLLQSHLNICDSVFDVSTLAYDSESVIN